MSKRKYKQYDEIKMQEAIDCVEDGMSKYQAAIKFKVPRKTLENRISKGAPQKPGTYTHLSTEDEEQLLKYIMFMSDAGTPVTPKWIRETAGRIASERWVFCISFYETACILNKR